MDRLARELQRMMEELRAKEEAARRARDQQDRRDVEADIEDLR